LIGGGCFARLQKSKTPASTKFSVLVNIHAFCSFFPFFSKNTILSKSWALWFCPILLKGKQYKINQHLDVYKMLENYRSLFPLISFTRLIAVYTQLKCSIHTSILGFCKTNEANTSEQLDFDLESLSPEPRVRFDLID
jgi:hypothetical protein